MNTRLHLIFAVVLALVLGGCGTTTRFLPKQEIPSVPANLTVKCPAIPMLQESSNLGELVKYTLELMEQYNECAMRHDDLVRAAQGQQLINNK